MKNEKLIYKNHEKIIKIREAIDDGLDNFLENDFLKTCYNLDDVYYFHNIDEILVENDIDDEKIIEAVRDEFDEQRIQSSYDHALDYHNDCFCYHDLDFEIDFDSIKLKDSLNNYITERPIINYLSNFSSYENILEVQFEILKSFYKQFKIAYKTIKNKCDKLEEIVAYANHRAKTIHREILTNDILDFIDSEKSIINEQIEKIRFDYIARIENEKAITNRGAVVPIKEAKKILKQFLNGVNVVNKKIGNYTILKIFNIKNTVFLRIGCHLIKIDDQLKQQLI